MHPHLICQSCTMPIDNPADRGTATDGNKSTLYCKYCYQDGAFVNPEMPLEEMEKLVAEKMHEMHLPEQLIRQSLQALPRLDRWRKEMV